MKNVRLINENGNVSAKVRANLKTSMVTALMNDTKTKYGFASSMSADGDIAMYIADDAKTGEPIYAFISVTISMRDPAVKTAKSKTKSKKKATKDEPMPDIFASADEGEDEGEQSSSADN